MPRIARSPVATRLLLVSAVGLFGCPQLLEDRFGTLNGADAGPLCQGVECGFTRSNDSGGSAGVSGTPGTGGVGGTPTSEAGSGGASGTSGAGGQSSGGAAGGSGSSGSAGTTGSAGAGGTVGSSGSSGTGGAAGTSGTAGTGGSAGTSGIDYSCWTLDLTSSTQDNANNCVGIDGWNAAVFQAPSSLTASYQDGDVCLSGSIGTSGWGAVFNLTFNGDEDGSWDATTAGVTGFELGATGSALPPSLQVIYSVGTDDYCRAIVPSGLISVPFTSTHPGCSTDSSSGTPDRTQLSVLRLTFPVLSSTYNVNFCLQIRALP